MGIQRNVILFIATSLDGLIAKEDDSLEWLFNVEGEGDNGYETFYNTVDTIIMGRKTYDQVLHLEKGNFPYKNKKCYVFSRSNMSSNEYVEFVSEDIRQFTNRLKNEEGKNIWLVGGGELLTTFIKERLIDEMIITIAPTIIGRGIPLFKDLENEIEYSLKEITRINQFAQLHYYLK
ncbi:dihydrofolate reductase [Cytobacillus suaedae]|nr:dihydrofolate reductase [Cytobacillus suaedae]